MTTAELEKASLSTHVGAVADPGDGSEILSPYAGSGEGAIAESVGRRVYVDIHRTRKNGEGFRITFTTDGVSFKHVESFTDLPVEAGDKVFVDVLPLQHTDGVVELLRKGVEVYYLRRLTLIRRKREELKMSKTTRNDIRALMTIEGKRFRRVSEDFMVMRRMIAG